MYDSDAGVHLWTGGWTIPTLSWTMALQAGHCHVDPFAVASWIWWVFEGLGKSVLYTLAMSERSSSGAGRGSGCGSGGGGVAFLGVGCLVVFLAGAFLATGAGIFPDAHFGQMVGFLPRVFGRFHVLEHAEHERDSFIVPVLSRLVVCGFLR